MSTLLKRGGAHALALVVLLMPFAVGAAEPIRLRNPLQFDTITSFIEALLRSVVYIALPIISLFIVYAGFQFVTAQGNTSKLEAAKKNFLYVIIGALLILGAWALAQLIGNTINELRS